MLNVHPPQQANLEILIELKNFGQLLLKQSPSLKAVGNLFFLLSAFLCKLVLSFK